MKYLVMFILPFIILRNVNAFQYISDEINVKNAIVIVDKTNFRANPSIDSPVINILVHGTVVEILGKTQIGLLVNNEYDYFYKVKVGDQEGYIWGNLISENILHGKLIGNNKNTMIAYRKSVMKAKEPKNVSKKMYLDLEKICRTEEFELIKKYFILNVTTGEIENIYIDSNNDAEKICIILDKYKIINYEDADDRYFYHLRYLVVDEDNHITFEELQYYEYLDIKFYNNIVPNEIFLAIHMKFPSFIGYDDYEELCTYINGVKKVFKELRYYHYFETYQVTNKYTFKNDNRIYYFGEARNINYFEKYRGSLLWTGVGFIKEKEEIDNK